LWGGPELQQRKNLEKKEGCSRLGIHLIEIPYWWDGNISSLQATIEKKFPEIAKKYFAHVTEKAAPISEQIPTSDV